MAERRPVAWIAHDQMKRDKNGELVSLDTRPAEQWGERRILFHDSASGMEDGDAMQMAREKLVDFQPDDYLVFLGAPHLIAVAQDATRERLRDNPLQLLIWNNRVCCYDLHVIGGKNGRTVE